MLCIPQTGRDVKSRKKKKKKTPEDSCYFRTLRCMSHQLDTASHRQRLVDQKVKTQGRLSVKYVSRLTLELYSMR